LAREFVCLPVNRLVMVRLVRTASSLRKIVAASEHNQAAAVIRGGLVVRCWVERD
jgi:hypothetical protein